MLNMETGRHRFSFHALRLMIITFDPPENVGGVEGRAGAYTRELMRASHFVELIALAPKYKFSAVDFRGATLQQYPSSLREVPRSFRSAVREINRRSIDSVFLLSGALTLFGAVTLLYARMTGRKSVIFIYGKDILGAKRSPLQRLLFLAAALLAGKVAVNSRYTARLLPRFVAPKAGVLYPGVDPGISRDLPRPASAHSPTILFVGRLVERKGADDLIRAYASMRGEHPDLVLEIVGDGPDKGRLKSLAAELGVGGYVRFFGTLTGQALYERYSSADVFAMPSRTERNDVEGFGTVFLEEGVFGRPSIGTRSGGIPEAVVHGMTGLVVPERDVGALRNALRELLANEDERRTLGENARKYVLSSFTWEAGTRSLISLLESKNS